MWFVYTVAVIYHPYVGLELENVNGQWIVTYSDPQGVGYKSGVRVGDLIFKINQDDPGKNRFVQIWSEAEGASTLEVRRLDQPNDQMINIPVLPILQNSLNEIPLAILGFVFWLLGFITWFRRPFLVQARALFWLNWCIGLAVVLAPVSSRDLLLARELELIIFSAVPIFLINFVSVLPNENKKRVNRWGCLMLILMFVIILIVTVLQSVGIVHFFSPLRKLVLATMSIGIFFALWNLGTLLILPKDKPEKNTANILLLGMVIGFLPFVLLTAIPIIFGFQLIMDAHVSSLFVSVIPVIWYYAIVNKYLPDSRRLLRTIISYFTAGVIISFVVSYLYFVLKLSSTFNLVLYLTTLSFTMLFIVCFCLIRVVVNKLLDKYLFPERKQTFKKRMLELNESLSMLNEEDQMLEELTKNLGIEGAFIIVEDAKGGYLKKAVGRFSGNPSEQVELEGFLRTDQKINLDAKILPKDFPAELYIPVISHDYMLGIFLGHRYSCVKFELDELPLITLISSQLAYHLVTMLVIKELSKEIKDLAQRSLDSRRRHQGLQGITTSLFRNFEKEKKSIAYDIHDGPLQLGLDLDRWLKYLVEEYPANGNDKTVEAISHMREVVENLNFELRLICNDLRPPSLTDLGLLSAIELLCEEIMKKELLLISLETKGISHGERFKEEVELVAYRFLQEGITNAVKHSDSDKVKIRVELNEAGIELTVKDLGKGFDTSKIDDWSLTGAHFGIVGMKERLKGLGGQLQISSTIHQGTMLKATIPITLIDG
ncbi:Sensor protein comP [Desulfosporosinus metallidurans]|uniref:histidine kinase n=1 Tax=Desulfosporosinus metallidurans TaxID=1888891 RepID=A0A1Q8QDX5_9FIRM|nr:Sensor protein comP [Desulfosporosinus metallidurans]